MKFRGLFFLLLFLILSCNDNKTKSETVLDYFPSDMAAVLRINDMARFKSEFKNNDFLATSGKLPLFSSMSSLLDGMEFMKPESNCVAAFFEVGKNKFEFVLITDAETDFFDLDKAVQKTAETMSYENQEIKKYELEGSQFFSTLLNDKLVIASSQLLLENLLRIKNSNPVPIGLQQLYETADTKKSASLFLNLDAGKSFVAPDLKEQEQAGISNFSDWVSLDFNTDQDHLGLNGVTVPIDSTKSVVALFENTAPLVVKTPMIAPINSQAILTYTFDDYESFARNQIGYLDKVQEIDTVFTTLEEIGLVFLNGKKVVVLNSYGTSNISQFLDSKRSGAMEYQGSEIVSIDDALLISKTFDPLVTNFESNFYAILENNFVFCSDRETLQTIISNYKNNATFDKSMVFTNAMKSLANESNILFISGGDGIEYFLENEFLPNSFSHLKAENLREYSFAAQVVADKSFYHTNATISKIEKTNSNNTVSPLFTLELDADLAIDPQFVTNHRTNKQEIVVQDKDNNLYLISTEGKVLWKKPLEGKIQGKISQVDIYKNGRLQLAFCTNDKFLVLDRNGKVVEPFNKDFEGGNLNELAVFDYEGKRNYRFVVTQGEKVFMYNSKGQIVDGFTYTNTGSPIIKAPKHFRMGQRDYLVFQLENNELKIRHRAGQERIKVSEKIDFSNNEVFLYKNRFSVTNKKGVLHQIDPSGKMTKADFNLNQDHGMYATSKTLALMNDNVLSIKGKKMELDLGVYTPPKIFYIYDKIYVAVTDIQSRQIYLFDSQAKSISNFPVFGNSMIDLADIDNDRKLELVAKDQENSIIVYKLN